MILKWTQTLLWRHNGRDGVSNHQPHDCLLNGLFMRRSKKTSKLRVTGLCAGNSPVAGEFPAQMSSNAENVSIWWRHHDKMEWIEARNQKQTNRILRWRYHFALMNYFQNVDLKDNLWTVISHYNPVNFLQNTHNKI